VKWEKQKGRNTWCEGVDWIHMAQNEVECWGLCENCVEHPARNECVQVIARERFRS